MLQKISNILAALALVFGLALVALAVYLMFFNEPPPPPPPPMRLQKPAVQPIAPNVAAPAKLPTPQ
jgi:multidrug efflux pump subunit AcrA (membrane-fusion protein)